MNLQTPHSLTNGANVAILTLGILYSIHCTAFVHPRKSITCLPLQLLPTVNSVSPSSI